MGSTTFMPERAELPGAPLDGGGPIYRNYSKFKRWDRFFQFDAEAAAYYSGELGTGDLAGKNLLEIGFGSGGFLAWASEAGARVAGTELQPESLQAARERGIALLDPDLASVAGRHGEAFDYIVAFDVLEHLALSEVVRMLDAAGIMLKPGGELLLRFPNGQSPFGLADQYGDATHIQPLSAEIVAQLVEGSDLTVARSGPIYRVYGPVAAKWPVRWIRYRLQDLLGVLGRFIYPSAISYAPVITVVLAKRHRSGV